MNKRNVILCLGSALLTFCSVAFGAGNNAEASFFQIQLQPVPEPGSLAALAGGIGCFWMIAKCRRRR